MAIDPQTTDTVTIPQLDHLTLALQTFLVGSNADGKMGNFTANELATFIAPYVSLVGSSDFIPVSGTVLPDPTEKPTAYTLVGANTFTQTTGGNITTDEPLNLLGWNGTTWALLVEIPIVLTDYVTQDEFAPANSIINASVNLINFQTDFESGGYNITTGAKAASVNQLRVDIIPVKSEWIGVPMTLSGFGFLPNSLSRVLATNGSGTILYTLVGDDSDLTPVTFTPAVGWVDIRIVIANIVGIGNDPLNNQFVNTLQLEVSPTATAFQPFGASIDWQNVKGISDEFAKSSDLQATDTRIDDFTIFNNFLDKSGFLSGLWTTAGTHTPSNNWLKTGIVELPDDVDDFILTGYGPASLTTARILLLAEDQTTITDTIMSLGLTDLSPVAFSKGSAKYAKLNIANVVNIGVNPTNNVYTESVMLRKSGTDSDFIPYGEFLDSSKLWPEIDDNETYSPFYVDLLPVSSAYAGVLLTQEVGRIYERLKDNIYACHSLQYERLDFANFVSGDFAGGEIVRYAGTKLKAYDPDTNTFIDLAKTLVITLESELVMNTGGWVGGYHGNETFSTCHLIVDNKAVNSNGKIGLVGGLPAFTATGVIPCKSFSYVQQSVMVNDSDKSSLNNRKKVVTFEDGGYKVNSKFGFLQVKNVMMYAGICCVAKYFTELISDSGIIVVPSASTLFPIDNDKFAREVMYSSIDISLEVTSFVFDKSVDDVCIVRVWDRSTDTKYYRQIPNYVSAVGSYLETEMKVVMRHN